MNTRNCLAIGVILTLLSGAAAAQESGRIEGFVVDGDRGLGGVSVVVSELGTAEVTRNDGGFRFDRVPPGTYTLSFTLGERSVTRDGVEVGAGQAVTVRQEVDWKLLFAETILVSAASRRPERITEAPAAVTLITEEQIARELSYGQLPKLLEFTPGVAVTQGGLYDYNLNSRGFNSTINRRILVLVDGRDPSLPFLGSQEWATVSLYMNDLESAEMVRGPSSALYGANAYNGVLNLVTSSPRTRQGGELRLTAGNLDTRKFDGRWAGGLGHEWYLKVSGSYLSSDDFSADRVTSVEYEGLPFELVPRPVTEVESALGFARLDKYFANGDFLVVEAGLADTQVPSLQTGIGRFTLPDVRREWSRLSYTSRHWNVLGYFNTRDGDDQVAFSSGTATFNESETFQVEVQTSWELGGRARLVAGATYGEDDIDSPNPDGVQTLLFEPVSSDASAVYGQLDIDLTDRLKLVLAGRFDESSLHESELSPKGSLVYGFRDNHSLRLSFNEAFQVANYSEFFLQADGAAPVDLRGIEEAVCTPFGVSCGFGSGATRIIGAGNRDLDIEQVRSLELGYTGILGGRVFLTVELYANELEDFISELLPQLGTSLGRLNPNFGPYQPPADHPDPELLVGILQGALGPLFPILSNNFDGTPIFVPVSFTNFGKVETEGLDLGVNAQLTSKLRLNAAYSFFDFEIKEEAPDNPLFPNAPENQYKAGLAWVDERFDVGLNYRYVDRFFWSGGLFVGFVESYDTADLNARFQVDEKWTLGVNVSNLFDNEHFEAFGGDLIGRRSLAFISYRW